MTDEFRVSTYCIKSGYCARTNGSSATDNRTPTFGTMRTPDVYALAAFLAARAEAKFVINIGCHGGLQGMMLPGVHKIEIAQDQIIDVRAFSERAWHAIDAESGQKVDVTAGAFDNSVVICANVIERLADPSPLLAFLSSIAARAHAVIITTPERDVVRGPQDYGPPADPAHAREWNFGEFKRLLHTWNLRPTFLGLTIGSIHEPVKDTLLAIVDRCPLESAAAVPVDFRPLVIMATYNDQDVISPIVNDLLDNDFDVHILDNWSTDGTFEQLSRLSTSRGGLKLERFPSAGPTRHFEWRAILARKEELAAQFPGRWVIHQDSDELRRSPWPEISLRGGLYIAERTGFDAIDFTVCEFRPIDDTPRPGDPESAFKFFEFGKRSGHFLQAKAWRQGNERVDLASSGGHEASFPGRRTFPYKFLMKHFPLRSPTQARQKLDERRSRISPHEVAMGWHIQYNHFTDETSFVWPLSELLEFDEWETRRRFLVEMISGIGIAR